MRIRGNFCLTEINNESIESRIIVHVMNKVVTAATWHYQKGISDLRNKDKTGAQYPIRRPRDFCQRGGGGGGGGVLARLLDNSSDIVFFFSLTPQLI